ncbi:hypothetical protein AWB67_02223 [Caballeronia terrestris]|uniref:Uncharacterized protein n=1 Tax=Caballeronia terrestris TaxID=1226301 RepID=A0A158HYA7_9BURK|nr:hypothetical protein AWB67_02223 [Caballeronia terrestris]
MSSPAAPATSRKERGLLKIPRDARNAIRFEPETPDSVPTRRHSTYEAIINSSPDLAYHVLVAPIGGGIDVMKAA